MSEPKVSRLRGVALCAPKMSETKDFYTEVWGLTPVAEEAGTVYFRGTAPEHHILSIHDADHRGIQYINLAAQDRAAMQALFDKVKDTGVKIAAAPRDLDTPGGGVGFDIVDPDNRLLRVAAEVEQHHEFADRPDAPRKITHCVLNTPQLETALDFYQSTLGFQISDWSENQMVFIRCNVDHHSIAFNRADHASLNHIAFEMPSIDAQMKGIGRMKRHGRDVGWGVGRHGPGNNTFSYFTDPSDFVIEYTAEVERIDPATHEPRVWKRTPELMDRWGTAGPPPPGFRKYMAGEPDPGYQG